MEGAFASIAREHARAVLVLGSAFVLNERQRLGELAIRHRLPTMFQQREAVEAGGLMSYTGNRAEAWRTIATYIDKILKGATPADLPVERFTKFELVLNRKTAQALGLTLPPSLLFQADRVIQ